MKLNGVGNHGLPEHQLLGVEANILVAIEEQEALANEVHRNAEAADMKRRRMRKFQSEIFGPDSRGAERAHYFKAHDPWAPT